MINNIRDGRLMMMRSGLITLAEGMSRGAPTIILVAFAAVYPAEEYVRLLPWLACQQLIVTFAPFGLCDAMGRIVRHLGVEAAEDLRTYIPKYVAINLIFAIPLSLVLTWTGTHRHIISPSPVDLSLVTLTGIWLTTQRTRQGISVLTGRTIEFAKQRSVLALTQFTVSFLLARKLPIFKAFFLGQAAGLFAAEIFDRGREVGYSAKRTTSLYWEITQQSWIYGLWSVFGWFSGLGSTILLARFVKASTLTTYGQALSISGLMSLCLGGISSAIQANLLRQKADWSRRIQKKVNLIYNASIFVVIICAVFTTIIHLEDLAIMHRCGLHWPNYIWLYFLIMYGSLTLYQRVIIRYWYDNTVFLPWTAVAVSEIIALVAFAIVLKGIPQEPLWASAALITGRCVGILIFARGHSSTEPQMIPIAAALQNKSEMPSC